ncbi:hypothetical protein D3C80_1534010 [compost metagenome]
MDAVIYPQRQRIYRLGAAHHLRLRCQTLDNTGLGADHGDGLTDLVVQLPRHLAPGLFFCRDQRARQLAVFRQPQPQLLVQLTLALNSRAEQQTGQALGQQRQQQITVRFRLGRFVGHQHHPIKQGCQQRALPAVAIGHKDYRDGQTKRREAAQLCGIDLLLQPDTERKQQ